LLNFLYLYQVAYLANHAANGGMILMLDCLLEFAEPQGANGFLLVSGTPNRASHIFHTQCCHYFLLCLARGDSRLRRAAAPAALTPFATTPAITALATFARTPARWRACFAGFLFTGSAIGGSLLSGGSGSESQAFRLFLANDFLHRFPAQYRFF
jgi:hypothetical protein